MMTEKTILTMTEMTTISNSSIGSSKGKAAAAVIVAAGSSSRMGKNIKKEYLPLNRGTVLSQTAAVFLGTELFSTIVVVCPHDGKAAARDALLKGNALGKEVQGASDDGILLNGAKVIITEGSDTRQGSVLNGLSVLEKQTDKPQVVLIHDGARPFASAELIKSTYESALKYGAAVPALQPVDTQKEIDESGTIRRHLVRAQLAAVQTPQGFLFDKILEYHRRAKNQNAECTDDTEIWDMFSNQKTHVIPGESANIKITYPKDIAKKEEKMIRTGLGSDLHRLVEGRKLFLGGVEIPFEKGEDGHSDGDVLLHAVTDALLGASALGDIGSYFPPEDDKWKGADSKMLLSYVWNDIKNAGWELENLDCVIKLEKPKFLPYRNQVRASIADILGVEKERVFVKAKTGEKLGDIGQGLAIEALATCLLSSVKSV